MGPLIFLIYIDYLKYYLSEANIIIFADDTLLLLHVKNLPSLFKKMEIALTEFISWADSQYLTLNYGKTNYILFSRIGSVQTDLNLIVKNNIINRVKTCRYLGFIIYENMSWNEHAKLIGNKFSRSLGVIRRLKFRFPKKKNPENDLSNFISCYKRIQIIQNKAIEIISPLQHSDNINLHFKLTKIFDVSFSDCNFLF